MKRLERKAANVYALGAQTPMLEVRVGEPFLLETEDASGGLLSSGEVVPSESNLPYTRFNPIKANPVAGPVFVDGIRSRSRVTVEIHEIRLAGSGVFYHRPSLSPLAGSTLWPAANDPWATSVRHEGTDAVLDEGLRWPLRPMIGTLACAPEWEVRSTATGQGPWGGNLDVLDFTPGARVFLNAYHDGALLYAGDVHGCQGSGEYFGVADESRAEVVLSVSPCDGDLLPFPRVETPGRIVALGIGKPLEEAASGAAQHLMSWLVAEYGFTHRQAYLTVALNPDFSLQIHQMTAIRDLQFVVGASIGRDYLV